MKKFLLSAASFCFVLVPVLLLADYLLSQRLREGHTIGLEIWKDVMEGNAGADIVILGNSRAYNSCDREVLDRILGLPAYNLTSIGNPFISHLFRYDMYRKYNRKPQLVILFVDNFFLGRLISQYDPVQYLPWMWRKPFFQVMLTHPNKIRLLQSSIPFQRYRGSRPWNLISRPQITHNGFIVPENATASDSIFVSQPCEVDFVYEKETDDKFREFLRRSAEEGIRVVLVFPPLHDSYGYKEGHREAMHRYFEDAAAQTGTPIFDASTMELVHDSTYFRNTGHLSFKGARVFSDTLARYLAGPEFKSGQ